MRQTFNSLGRSPSAMSGEHQALLITWLTLRWSTVVAAACYAGASQQQGTEGLVRIEGRMNVAKYREVLEENLLPSARDLRLWRVFTFQHDNNPKHTASTQVSDCPWVAQPKPRLKPNRTSTGRDLKLAVQMLPIQSDRPWEDLPVRMGNCLNPGVQTLYYRDPRRDQAVIAAKGASRKYWIKGLNIYIN